MNIRHLIPFFDASVKHWGLEARLLRWLTFLWLSIGLVALFSASYVVAEASFGDGLHYFKTQLLWVGIGLVGFNILVHSPLRAILRLSDWLLLLCLVLVLATLLPGLGTTVSGSTRWLVIGPIGIQPSELIKPFLVLQAARIFGQWERLATGVRLSWLGIFLVVIVSVLLQPNLSTASLCGLVIWLIALSSGLPYRYLLGTALGGVLLATISIGFQDYQRRRLTAFLDPWSSSSQDGYQLIQSLLAIGSGGFWGAGFGLSQQKLFYLPIQYTDFIFAVFAEEFGFIGSLMLLTLLAAFATLGIRVALRSEYVVYQLVAIGSVGMLVGQALLNIGVATGALPTTGLPFPMLSYGGSSMIASLMAAGMLVRVARESNEAKVIPLETRQLKPRPYRPG